MFYVKINNSIYPGAINGKINDRDWDNRESKEITLDVDFATMNTLFSDGAAWGIVSEEPVQVFDEQGAPVLDENGDPTYEFKQTEFDNSEYSIRGDLIVHVDGTCTVKMGKPTDLEDAYEILYGGM
jgi:hypothetical protein